MYWLTSATAELKKTCNAKLRRYQRAGRRAGHPNRDLEKEEYGAARKVLRNEIRSSQDKCWREMCDAVDFDPWGVPFRVVTRKLGRQPAGAASAGRESEIADHLFPIHPNVIWSNIPIEPEAAPPPPLTLGNCYRQRQDFLPEKLQDPINCQTKFLSTRSDGFPDPY